MPRTRRISHLPMEPIPHQPLQPFSDVEWIPTTKDKIQELLVAEYQQRDLPDEEVGRLVQLGLRLLGLVDETLDTYNKRPHYNQTRFEVIEIIDDFGLDFYRGGILKYLLRAPYTPDVLEQFKKAQYYLNRLVRLTSLNQGPFGQQALDQRSRVVPK